MITLNETERRFCADVCGLQVHCIEACGECALCDAERERKADMTATTTMHRPEVVAEMREWLKDLDWVPQRYVDRASNREVVRMVQDQYDGGVVGWYRDIEGIGPDVCHLCAAMGLHLDGCPDIG